MELRELRRLAFLSKNTMTPVKTTKRARFTPMSAPVKTAQEAKSDNSNLAPGMQRLIRFIELIDKLGNVPWANQR